MKAILDFTRPVRAWVSRWKRPLTLAGVTVGLWLVAGCASTARSSMASQPWDSPLLWDESDPSTVFIGR